MVGSLYVVQTGGNAVWEISPSQHTRHPPSLELWGPAPAGISGSISISLQRPCYDRRDLPRFPPFTLPLPSAVDAINIGHTQQVTRPLVRFTAPARYDKALIIYWGPICFFREERPAGLTSFFLLASLVAKETRERERAAEARYRTRSQGSTTLPYYVQWMATLSVCARCTVFIPTNLSWWGEEGTSWPHCGPTVGASHTCM